MRDLLEFVLAAHGGRKRWSDVRTLTTQLAVEGPLLEAQGFPDAFLRETLEIDVRRQHAVFTPYSPWGALQVGYFLGSPGSTMRLATHGARGTTRSTCAPGSRSSAGEAAKVHAPQIFSGTDVPPPEFSSDADVVAYVRARTGAIGYVSAVPADGSVKVVRLLP